MSDHHGHRRLLFVVVAGLFVLTAVLVFVKVRFLDFSLSDRSSVFYQLDAMVSFLAAAGQPVRVSLALPELTPGLARRLLDAAELPEELKESKAGRIIGKVVTGANALLQGTAMLTLSDEVREMEGGLTLKDGNIEINCAFETQLRILRESMAAQVAGVLFP